MTPQWLLVVTRQRLSSSHYQEYIHSSRWRRKRLRYMRWHGHRCHDCWHRPPKLHIHHKTYKRLGRERIFGFWWVLAALAVAGIGGVAIYVALGLAAALLVTRPGDLVGLCPDCHENRHKRAGTGQWSKKRRQYQAF
jgi:hypothetical protein